MISVSDTMIMIVPDFGGSADDEAMVALKKAIVAAGSYTVKVVDLPAVVRAEHDGEELPDAKVIELSARKLEQLATCKELVWDGTNTLEQMECRVIRLGWSDGKLRRLPGQEQEDEPKHQDEAEDNEEEDIFDIDETIAPENIDETIDIENILRRRFPHCSDDTYDWGAPDIVVVFGKSAMLAGGLGQKNVLFINPEYDSEWPWKKQYYADQKLAGQYHCDKYEYERGFMETVIWMGGSECTSPWQYSRRYGLITSGDYIGEFWNHYPGMAEVDRALDRDTDGLAKFICDFADGKLTFPLEEVYRAIKNLPGRNIPDLNMICDFIEPVKLDGITVLGLRFGPPMANGQSCNKLKVAERDYTLPLESVHTRRELNALRDAIVRVGEGMSAPAQKRILIVPDYFTPYKAPNVRDLYDRLRDMGYYVAVYVHGSSLEKSRAGIERRCKVKPFDLLVTLETGCLMTGRVANCPRVMVNPDWAAWEWMRLRLGEDKNRTEHRGIDNSGSFYTFYLDSGEVAMARHMAERSYFRRSDKPIYGWFTVDTIESHLPQEHLKRFNTSTYIPDLRLDTEEGIDILARQIDNILTIDSNE